MRWVKGCRWNDLPEDMWGILSVPCCHNTYLVVCHLNLAWEMSGILSCWMHIDLRRSMSCLSSANVDFVVSFSFTLLVCVILLSLPCPSLLFSVNRFWGESSHERSSNTVITNSNTFIACLFKYCFKSGFRFFKYTAYYGKIWTF